MDIKAIELTTLPDGQQGLSGIVEATSIQDRFADDGEVCFSKPADFRVQLNFRGQDLTLSGEMNGSYQQRCGRCLEMIEKSFSEKLNLRFHLSDRGLADLADGELLLESTVFNLEEALIDSCVLLVHPFAELHDDCSAIGSFQDNPSEKSKLGALLSQVLSQK